MPSRSSFVPRFAFMLLALLLPLAAHAALPELDRSLAPGPDARVAASLNRLRTDPALLRIGNVAHVDERYGVPTFVWAAPTPARATAAAPVSRGAAARGFLGTVAPLYGLDARDVRDAPLRYVHDTGRGGVIAAFTQRVNGVDVFRDELKVLMDRSGRLLAATGSIPSQTALARAPLIFRLRATDAVGRALDDFAGRMMQRGMSARGAVDGYETFAPGATLATAAGLTPDRVIRAKKVYFHAGSTLVPGWYVELMGEQQAYSYVIADADGSLLFRHSLIANDSYNYRVWAATGSPFLPHDGPQGTSASPHPTGMPDFFTPPFTAPSLVALQNSPYSNNDPWLPPGATVTTGNNVDAYADLASPDGFSAGDLRASTTSAGTFDRTYDTALAPNSSAAQQMASITQLFYDNNFFHDWYYDSGFDEASGNGQSNNFGRGGLGGDPVHAEAQDYSGTNNANMSTPSDGGSPRMQMYVFTVTVNNLTVNAPSAIAGSKDIGTASFGPQSFTTTGNVVLAVDGVVPVNDGCSAISGAVSGKIALIDRGTCGFINKVQNAQAAGAIGVLIANNVANTAPPAMGGAGAVSIPSLSITKELGDSIKTQLGLGTVNVTLQRGAETNRDGTIDQQIVAHEWGHYISNRLIGDANGLSNQQGGGMGEGWGDFHAMLLTVRPEDALVPSNANYNGVYGLASYATGSSHNNSYYFGIRRLPYSTDMTKNALTFHHITNGVTLPSGPPTAFGQDGSNNAEVHNIGEVWCTMLWECYAALLRDTGRLTFDQAQSRMKDYLVAAYKLTPNAPTMVEARDAVLAAAYANDPADYSAFWTAFAKRGMGVGAVAPDRSSTDGSGVIESFVVGGDVAFVSGSVIDDLGSCDHDGYLDEGETGTLTVTLRNSGAVTLNSTTATVTSPTTGVTFPSGNTINFPSSAVFTNTVASLPVKLTGAGPGPVALSFQVSYGDPAQVTPNPQNATVTAYGRVNETPSATETMEEQLPGFTFATNPSFADAPFSKLEVSGTDHKLFGPDPGSQADTWAMSPPLNVAATGSFSFTFSHSFSFEQDATNAYDGGMIELSNNGGASWVDIGASASPGYNGTLFTGSNNPLSGRNAFVRTSPSYPSSNVVTVNLGTTYAGQTVQIRFRIGCDEAAGGAGWQIDDVAFTNLTNQPFQSIVADPGVCAATAVGDDLPTELAFAIAGATPSRGDVGLRFALPTATHVNIAVFDVTGRKVATLADGAYEPGRYSTTWKRGGAGGSGVYFARMIAGGRTLTQRVLVLR